LFFFGAGAKKLDACSWSLKFELGFHNPASDNPTYTPVSRLIAKRMLVQITLE